MRQNARCTAMSPSLVGLLDQLLPPPRYFPISFLAHTLGNPRVYREDCGIKLGPAGHKDVCLVCDGNHFQLGELRAAPQFQHEANCPSNRSPHEGQVQALCGPSGCLVAASRNSQALGKSLSSTIHNSG